MCLGKEVRSKKCVSQRFFVHCCVDFLTMKNESIDEDLMQVNLICMIVGAAITHH